MVDAVNVALLLGQPLLVTGEPGTGKTLLADHIAWRLGLGEKERYQAKSTSGARDLFYTYDTLGRFNAAHTGKGGDPLTYLRYQALGRAILLANEIEMVREWLNFQHPGKKQRSVVLIDEVDKAPRDFPNDILAEVEEMKFSIPELDVESISADPSMRPVLVITSNSERQLPEAFLRRCIYYHIPFPDDDRLEEIIRTRIESLKTAPAEFLGEALELFEVLRQKEWDLRKRPATAELLNWLSSLDKLLPDRNGSIRKHAPALRKSLSALVKNSDDQVVARRIVNEWTK